MKTRRIKFAELKSKRKRFGGLDCSGRKADCKSAIRQTASLRYVAGSSVGIGRRNPVVPMGLGTFLERVFPALKCRAIVIASLWEEDEDKDRELTGVNVSYRELTGHLFNFKLRISSFK
ncbi:hypothetical protein [Pedosphaera parvula]|uniref:Uncharacterized protein n=1 Tax=Pedosphaera parvula (strain Ellin514) TaxID=320771 RepID=B9XME5_PEDPL|nr:hypothetical protein [Pedosphaera parvula]EEF58987.1 hypothetical protein Cflav_PD2036 [Pedosphaera parvula Ellin514]